MTLQARARDPLEGHTFLSTFSTVLSHRLHQQRSECKPGSPALGAASIPSGSSSCCRAKPQFSSPRRDWVSSCDLYWAWDRPQGQDLRPQGPMDRVSKTESQGRTRRWKPHLTRRAARSPPSQIITEGLRGPSGARTSNSYPQKLTVLDPRRNSPHPQLWQVSPISFSTPHGLSGGSYNAGDPGSIPGLGRSPGEGDGCPLQYSCLENPMDRGAW